MLSMQCIYRKPARGTQSSGSAPPEKARTINNIEPKRKDTLKESDAKVCPACGSEMVLRTAKRGNNAGNQFWGCSAFPKCRKILSS